VAASSTICTQSGPPRSATSKPSDVARSTTTGRPASWPAIGRKAGVPATVADSMCSAPMVLKALTTAAPLASDDTYAARVSNPSGSGVPTALVASTTTLLSRSPRDGTTSPRLGAGTASTTTSAPAAASSGDARARPASARATARSVVASRTPTVTVWPAAARPRARWLPTWPAPMMATLWGPDVMVGSWCWVGPCQNRRGAD
jgi:hypothetical protein